MTIKSLVDSWLLVMRHHVYEADALQVSASKEAECSLLLSADAKLVQMAEKEGVRALNIEAEPEKALATMNKPFNCRCLGKNAHVTYKERLT
jgi:hypothetical protein